MAFHIGQEVTMKTQHRWLPHDGKPAPLDAPQFGAIYRVIWMHTFEGRCYLKLAGTSGNWWSDRFRPVVRPTTDISIFTRMLDEVRTPEHIT